MSLREEGYDDVNRTEVPLKCPVTVFCAHGSKKYIFCDHNNFSMATLYHESVTNRITLNTIEITKKHFSWQLLFLRIFVRDLVLYSAMQVGRLKEFMRSCWVNEPWMLNSACTDYRSRPINQLLAT
jgi:hypothetical protein